MKNCVDKFANTNQLMMKTYVEVQGKINEKRMEEYQQQQQLLIDQQQQQQQQVEEVPSTNQEITEISIEPEESSFT